MVGGKECTPGAASWPFVLFTPTRAPLDELALRAGVLAGVDAALVRGDMRVLPFRAGSFAVAVNLFTSFGYFREDAEHGAVVREVATVLAPGGRFVLDFLNAAQVRRAVAARAQADGDPGPVRIRRRLSEDGRFVIKEIELRDEGRSFQERVRLFSAQELEGLLVTAGFAIEARLGDYGGEPVRPDSPRVILVGVRP